MHHLIATFFWRLLDANEDDEMMLVTPDWSTHSRWLCLPGTYETMLSWCGNLASWSLDMTNAMMLSDENPADVLKQNKKKTPDFRPGNFHVYAKSAALFIYL